MFNTYQVFSFSLEQELYGADCFTVYLKKEKRPDKHWTITYHLTQPVKPYKYNSPSEHNNQKYTNQDNCPSKVDIPRKKIERSK